MRISMKTLFRLFLGSFLGLWLTQKLVAGFKIPESWQTFLLASAALTFIYIFIKPILRLFFLPINLLSLGLLSWLINVAVLYLLTLFIPAISVSAWEFPGISYQGFVIPAYNLSQIATFVVTALTLSFIINFLVWLSK